MVYRVQFDASTPAPRRERFADWVKGPAKDTFKSFVTEMPRDAWWWVSDTLEGRRGRVRVPEGQRKWNYQYDYPWVLAGEPAPQREPFTWEQFRKDMAKDVNNALWLVGGGPVGGATATALRAAKGPIRQMVGAGTQFLINRYYPMQTINAGIDYGEGAPAVADLGSWAGAVGAGRLARWLGYRHPFAKPFRTTTGTILSALAGGLGGFYASKPLAEQFGGDPNDLIFLRGMRYPGNEDLVFDGQDFVFDPPLGKYPEWDRRAGRS